MRRNVWAPAMVPHRLDEAVLDCLLPAWTGVQLHYLAEHPNLPSLYDYAARGLVRYIPDRLGVAERWLGVPWILEAGGADCKSLACWRAAELLLQGERASVKHVRQADIFHVFVQRGDGRFEDPSTLTGMAYPQSWVWYK